VLGRFYWQRR